MPAWKIKNSNMHTCIPWSSRRTRQFFGFPGRQLRSGLTPNENPGVAKPRPCRGLLRRRRTILLPPQRSVRTILSPLFRQSVLSVARNAKQDKNILSFSTLTAPERHALNAEWVGPFKFI